MTSFKHYLNNLEQGFVFTEKDMESAIALIMQGEADEAQMESFLTHLHNRGETAGEIAGAAKAMRAVATPILAPKGTIDCCGTGGDGAGTYNISTAVALVAAACGVPVAKHGNRAASSKSGAADVLEALGVNLNLSRAQLESALRDIGFCFLMAPNHHQAMRHVVPVRRKLAHRTIFNLLGPLANPAGTSRQLIGVYDRQWILPVAQALQKLGTEKAWVVHGADGLDEISLSGETHVAALDNGTITEQIVTPDDFGLPAINNNDIHGAGVQENADALLALLNGADNAYRSIVLANCAVVLFIADNVASLKLGVKRASDAIDSGKALSVLNRYKDLTS